MSEPKFENSELFKDLCGYVKFTEAQSAMLDYHSRENCNLQTKLYEHERVIVRYAYRLWGMWALLVMTQILLLLLSAAMLRQRMDCVEKAILQLQSSPPVQLLKEQTSSDRSIQHPHPISFATLIAFSTEGLA
jgi:hypothetical protein